MKNTDSAKNKDQTYWVILNAAIELDIKKGHLKWTLSDLSRKSKITRSLIYYYFGKNKQDILKEAIKIVGTELIGLSPERMEMWKQGDFITSMKKARSFYNNAPYLPLFVIENRAKQNDIGEAIRRLEVEFLKKLKIFFTSCNDDQINSVFVIYWGLINAPNVTDETINIVVEIIIKNFK